VWLAAQLCLRQTAADYKWSPRAGSLPYICGGEPLTHPRVSEPGFPLSHVPRSSHQRHRPSREAQGRLWAPGRSEYAAGPTRQKCGRCSTGRQSQQVERACHVFNRTPRLRLSVPAAARESFPVAIQASLQPDSISALMACVLWEVCNNPLGRQYWRHAANIQRQRCRPSPGGTGLQGPELVPPEGSSRAQRSAITDMRPTPRKAASMTAPQQVVGPL
jgi:hypothetical protein